jgi:hypothetical protein
MSEEVRSEAERTPLTEAQIKSHVAAWKGKLVSPENKAMAATIVEVTETGVRIRIPSREHLVSFREIIDADKIILDFRVRGEEPGWKDFRNPNPAIADKPIYNASYAPALARRVRRQVESSPPPVPPPLLPAVDLADANLPDRRETTIHRIIRDTATARALKLLHRDGCQICGEALQMSGGGTYSEAHRIRPLGSPHFDPDTCDNIIVLCPNHHAQCDFLAITIDLATLHLHPDHIINQKHVEYHNDLVRLGSSGTGCVTHGTN